jgi:glycosyltransferase involved in cell wall biosynthesis
MRIALVTDTFLPEVNGVTTVLAVMRDGLRARGHRVFIAAPRYPGAEAAEPDLLRRPSVPCPGYGQVRLSSPFGGDVTRSLDEFRPDVVHVITEGPLGSIGRRYALRRGLPLVTSFHTDFPRYAARYLGAWAVRPAQAYLRRFHGRAHHTQTPSEVTRDELALQGIPQPVVWGRGVDTDLFTPARRREERRTAMGVHQRRLVLHVGRLAAEKDVETLVGAFTLARDRLGDAATFCVAGDGPRAAWVRSALPFAQHLGFLPRPVLADLYADADLFVFPSPTETCGLVALEAMASGLPVISSDAGGVLENLRDGLNGRTVRAGDAGAFAAATHALVQDDAQRLALGQAARAFAVARSWTRELDALEPLYADACARRPPVTGTVAAPVLVAT